MLLSYHSKLMKLTLETQYFNEVAKEGKVAIARPRGVSLPAWVDFEGNKLDPDNSPHTSTRHPRPSKQNRSDRKMTSLRKFD